MYGGEEGYEGEGGYEDEEEYEGEDGAEGEEGEIDLEGRVMLETAITRMDETSLELFYRVTNGLDHPILLTTPLPRVDADAIRPDPQRVYVYVDPEGVLQITKRLWPVPDDVEVVFPEVPFLTEVGPGGEYEERIGLILPIRRQHPYTSTHSKHQQKEYEKIINITRLTLSIACYTRGKKAPKHNADYTNYAAPAYAHTEPALNSRPLLLATSMDIDIPPQQHQ